MTGELYKKVYLANLKCIGIWHDFPVLGALEEDICWSEIKRYNERSLAKAEGKRFVDEMEKLFCDKDGTCRADKIEEMMIRLGMNEEKTISMEEASGKVSYWPPTCYEFAYKVNTTFEKVGLETLADESLLGKDWQSKKDEEAWKKL